MWSCSSNGLVLAVLPGEVHEFLPTVVRVEAILPEFALACLFGIRAVEAFVRELVDLYERISKIAFVTTDVAIFVLADEFAHEDRDEDAWQRFVEAGEIILVLWVCALHPKSFRLVASAGVAKVDKLLDSVRVRVASVLGFILDIADPCVFATNDRDPADTAPGRQSPDRAESEDGHREEQHARVGGNHSVGGKEVSKTVQGL